MKRKVHLFWDNSNIFHSAQNFAIQQEGALAKGSIRVEFENLYKLAVAARPVAKAVCVGSVPPEMDHVWAKIRRTGTKVELYERGAESGKEQGVDQALQVHMLRSLADNMSDPGIAVLLTGDGKGFDEGIGFHADLERMERVGWQIEVLSWDISCRSALRDWSKSVGVFIRLEDFYEVVTFTEAGRRAKRPDLRKRSS